MVDMETQQLCVETVRPCIVLRIIFCQSSVIMVFMFYHVTHKQSDTFCHTALFQEKNVSEIAIIYDVSTNLRPLCSP